MMNEFEEMLKSIITKPDKFIEKTEQDAGKIEPVVDNTELLKAMGVPKRLVSGLSDVVKRPTIKSVDSWYSNKDRWALFLSGVPDIGKSFAAAYWLSLVARDRYSHISNVGPGWQFWYQANDLTHISKDEYKRLWSAPYLVIDDLGAEYHSDSGYFQSILYSIISHRYDDMLPTVITCNLDGVQTKQRYQDERLLRRIRPPHAAGGWFTLESK